MFSHLSNIPRNRWFYDSKRFYPVWGGSFFSLRTERKKHYVRKGINRPELCGT